MRLDGRALPRLREALDVSRARHARAVALFLAVVTCAGAREVHSSLAWIRFPWSDVRYATAGGRGNREVVRRFQRYAPLASSKDVVMADMQESWTRYLASRVVVRHSAASRLSGLDDRTALESRDDYYEVRVVERNPPSRGTSAR